jgi:hypothetical protein
MDLRTDPHLNIFRYFNENHEAHFIENNLSRAFAICLRNDVLFFSEYLRGIVTPADYHYLFGHYEKDSKYLIDLQTNTGDIDVSDIKTIYAVAMTSNGKLSMEDFLGQQCGVNDEKNITDVWVLIKDIVLVIEVKRTWENCKQQLYNQIYPLISKNDGIKVNPVNFSWPQTFEVMERVINIRQMRQENLSVVNDFLSLCEQRYPYWFPTQAFYNLPPLSINTKKSTVARDKRLRQIIQQSSEQILPYSDRMAISFKTAWASEIIPDFRNHTQGEYLVFTIWPGNTKTQGYPIYGNQKMDWVKKDKLQVGERLFEIDTLYHMKFSHFNRHITSFDFGDADLLKPVNTAPNFYHKSGKWNIENWPKFEAFMDEHFKPDFNWRGKCNWKKYILDTERTYFTVSFGFTTDLWVPYKEIQDIDRSAAEFDQPVKFLEDIVRGFKSLLQ